MAFEETMYFAHEVTEVVEVCVDSGVTGGFQTNLTVVIAANDGRASE